jgi:hypothetical protein
MNGLAPWASCTSLLASLASASSVRLTPTHRLFTASGHPTRPPGTFRLVSTATSSRPARPPSGAATARSTMASAKAAMQSRRHSRQRQPEAGTFVNIGTPVQITGSEVNRWFLGFCTSMCTTPAGVSTSNQRPSFPGTAKTAPRGRLFLRASSLDTGICDHGATERPQSSDFLNFNRLLWGFTTRLKSHGLALILYTESRPCGLVRFRQA